MDSLFEAIDFVENPLYERIISDIANAHYSVIENFFSSDEVSILRTSLLAKHEEDAFKKAAIGNRTNEIIRASIRGDVILWIDEAKANLAETMFFDKINNLIAYLQAIIFITLGMGLLVILPLLMKKRTQCALFCPLGALQSVTGSINPYRVKIDKDKCNECGRCKTVCPTFSITRIL